MKKFALLVLIVFLGVLFLFGCSNDKGDNLEEDLGEGEKTTPEEALNEDSPGEKDKIDLGTFYVTVPPEYEGRGGHDGVSYNNAVLRPSNSDIYFEIEVGTGVSSTSESKLKNGLINSRARDNNAEVTLLDTEDWEIDARAYTYVRTHGDNWTSFTEYDESMGPSQVIGLVRVFDDHMKYQEIELRMEDESVSDYPEILPEFVSKNIHWTE